MKKTWGKKRAASGSWPNFLPQLENRRRTEAPRDFAYLGWIKTLPCAVCGTKRDIEAAHTGPRAYSRKSTDRQAIPLCVVHHREGPAAHHTLGRRFWGYHHIDRVDLVAKLNDTYDGRAVC